MGLVDFKEIADDSENEFYGKIYSYAFKKLRNVCLSCENSWSSNGFWFVVSGRFSNWIDSVWWGRNSYVGSEANPLLSQMRVCIPKEIFSKIYKKRYPNLGDLLKIPKSKRGDAIRVAIGKAIYFTLKQYNGLVVTFGYDMETLVDVSSIEELLIGADLNA